MTPMHVNRTLQQLRSEGLIELKNKVLTVLDPEQLREVARYESNYLHLVRTAKQDREVSGRAGDLVSPADQGLVDNTVESVKAAFGKPSR